MYLLFMPVTVHDSMFMSYDCVLLPRSAPFTNIPAMTVSRYLPKTNPTLHIFMLIHVKYSFPI